MDAEKALAGVAALGREYARIRLRILSHEAAFNAREDVAAAQAHVDALKARLQEEQVNIARLQDTSAEGRALTQARLQEARVKRELLLRWVPVVPLIKKSIGLDRHGSLQARHTPGILVTDAKRLVAALLERRMWGIVVTKPEKIAAALDAKALRPLCDAGEDALPGIDANDSWSLAWTPPPEEAGAE